MACISLPYGRGELTIQIDDERIHNVLISKLHGYQQYIYEEELIKEALSFPIASPPLLELVQGKEQIVIISSDHTRPVPSRITMPLLLAEIRRGNPQAHITILIATGFHRATTTQELRDRFGDAIVDREQISVHDCRYDAMVDMGILPSGGGLSLNSLAVQADLLLAEGFIEPHFFAGFSGGRKSVLPGIASRETVLANHCAEFIDHPHARAGILEDNPIHEDMLYAAQKAGLAFILNVVINSKKRIIQAFAGDPQKAHQCGCDFVSKMAGVEATPSPIVITSNDGYPLDQNIYQTVKGMYAASNTCTPGGVIICVARCEEGHGGEDFFNTFAQADSLQEVLEEIRCRNREKTIPDQWEAQILARILLQHTVILVTEAPREMVEAMKMKWAPDIEEALKMAAEITGGGEITVIPYGVAVIVQKKEKG